MTYPTVDPTYNPNVEVKEEDSRQFTEDGQLISGGVRIVTYVDGVEYNPKTLAEIAAEQEAAEQPAPEPDPFVVSEANLNVEAPGETNTPIGDEVAQEQPTSEQ